jgi:hypothetical protein
MISSTRLRLLFVIFFLCFAAATILAYVLHWDAFLYKRVQDTLVILIGTTGWILCARKILRGKSAKAYYLAMILLTIIVTMHVLRAIHGDLLC